MEYVDAQAALESEKVLLQAVLLKNDLMYLADSVKAEDLQTDYHRKMFTVIRDKVLAGENVDDVVLYEYFRQHSTNGVADYVLDFRINDSSLTYNIEPHIKGILRASQRRKIVAALESALAQAKDLSEENASVLSLTQDRLLEIQQHGSASRGVRISDFSDGYYSQVERIANHERGLGAFTTANSTLDELTTGIRPGEYVIVAGWTSDGKSAYSSQIIKENCSRGAKVFIFSQEMSKDAILQRCIPQVMNGALPASRLRDPRKMNGSDRALLKESKTIVDKWNLWVDDKASQHVRDMVASAYVAHRKHGIKLFIIDYLQLAKGEGKRRHEQVADVSKVLRDFAHNEKVAVIALSQFGRPENKVKRRPVLFDLKESGDIENDADLVIFVYRPIDKQGNLTYNDLLIVAKQREGGTGQAEVEFDRDQLAFLPRRQGGNAAPKQEQEEAWFQK